MARGAAIGVAVIIPGVSGGTLAVLLNIYDKLIDALTSLVKNFRKSFAFLLPVLLGAALAVCAMYFPIKYALKYAPLATVLLFAGLMAGSFPAILKEGVARGFNKVNILSVILPLAVVIGICFIPSLGEANLSSDMPLWGYPVLLIIGAAASCALVIPGVSGSMLLLIFGYYNSILGTVSALNGNFWHSLLVLFIFAAGLVIGFFSIARLMKYMLTKFPRGTYWAIIGFVLGSIPAIFITFNGNFADHTYADCSSVETAIGIILCLLGAIGTYALTSYAEKRGKTADEARNKTDLQDGK